MISADHFDVSILLHKQTVAERQNSGKLARRLLCGVTALTVSHIFNTKSAESTSLCGGDHLSRIAQSRGIKHIAHRHHSSEVIFIEYEVHIVDLVHPDSVLAGDGAADSYA